MKYENSPLFLYIFTTFAPNAKISNTRWKQSKLYSLVCITFAPNAKISCTRWKQSKLYSLVCIIFTSETYNLRLCEKIRLTHRMVAHYSNDDISAAHPLPVTARLCAEHLSI